MTHARTARFASTPRPTAIAADLRAALQRGDYYGGQRLIELTLAAHYGVSQATIREALRLLEADGWLTRQPRHGVTVRVVTPTEAAEVLALIAAIEGVVIAGWNPAAAAGAAARLRPFVVAAHQAFSSGALTQILPTLIDLHTAIPAPGSVAAGALAGLLTRWRLAEAGYAAQQPRSPTVLSRWMLAHDAAIHALRNGDTRPLLGALLIDTASPLR